MAARAGGRPVAAADARELAGAVTERTRLLVLCNPNDPTGEYLAADAIASIASDLPERVLVVVDEALVQFQDAEPPDAVLRLTDALPNLFVVRSFSKIYGLSGLRAGYAVGPAGSAGVLDAISPVLGVNALTQAAVSQALKIGGSQLERRRSTVIRERSRLLDALRELPVETTESQTNFVWLAAEGRSGAELAARLRQEGVIVAPGGPLGADDHVRATVLDAAATDRLLAALRKALG